MLRLLLAPAAVQAILDRRFEPALAIFLVAGVSDALDGFLARRWRVMSRLGAYLDPLADKALLSASYVALGYGGLIPKWLLWLVLGRDVFILLGAGLIYLFTRRRDFPPSLWGKLSTCIQIFTVAVLLVAGLAGPGALRASAAILVWPTAAITVFSGLHYAFLAARGPRPAGRETRALSH